MWYVVLTYLVGKIVGMYEILSPFLPKKNWELYKFCTGWSFEVDEDDVNKILSQEEEGNTQYI